MRRIKRAARFLSLSLSLSFIYASRFTLDFLKEREKRNWKKKDVSLSSYHSCELAYFKPSTTVEYIRLPHPAKARGANAVVLDVNCFKDCLSAMI
jgi:hypothetical protein